MSMVKLLTLTQKDREDINWAWYKCLNEKGEKNLSDQGICFHYYDPLSPKQHTVLCVFLNMEADV